MIYNNKPCGLLPYYNISSSSFHHEGLINFKDMNNNSIVAVLVLVVIVLVGWFSFKQGYFTGNKDNEQDIEINLPGTSTTP